MGNQEKHRNDIKDMVENKENKGAYIQGRGIKGVMRMGKSVTQV